MSEKLCEFNVEQVRMVLFRECDFRGRKLLFDSRATQKIPIEKTNQDEKFVEVTNGFGYLIVKSSSDYRQLSEMMFGSVAMSFRGTYFKIHSLKEPSGLMFTQVFPSPRPTRRKVSVSSQPAYLANVLSHSFEHSIKLDDSGASSTYSSEQLSDRSTASDTVLVCKRHQNSMLEMPRGVPSKNSLAVDSGCTDYSYSSLNSVDFSTWESIFPYKAANDPLLSFSSSNLLRRFLRTSSRSLVSSTCSLPNSAEEVLQRNHHHRSSKLGLAFVIEIPKEMTEFLTQFFMEHIALLEAMLWRARCVVEAAYHKPPTFMSVMVDLSGSTAAWLLNLLNGPKILKNFWHSLSLNCDSGISISASSKESVISRTKSYDLVGNGDDNGNLRLTNSFNGLQWLGKPEIFNFRLGKLLSADFGGVRDSCGGVSDDYGKFVSEFCEILEALDIKSTNFFISTLLTAILTHHLGWVSSCLSMPATPNGASNSLPQPYNALWAQLTDLYGAIGNPVKTAQTVVTGSDKVTIRKILNCLTYFIRFGEVERRNLERLEVEEENQSAEMICKKCDSIPVEYYKKYEDHLKDMLVDSTKMEKCEIRPIIKTQDDSFGKGLCKTKTFNNLMLKTECEAKCEGSGFGLKRVSSKMNLNLSKLETGSDLPPETKTPMCRRNWSCSKSSQNMFALGDGDDFQKIMEEPINLNHNVDKDVIFVLGDNEQLVGLKKEANETSNVETSLRKVSSSKRPSSLSFSKISYQFPKHHEQPDPFRDDYCSRTLMPSTSYESLYSISVQNGEDVHSESESKKFTRCQSEPPEERKSTKPRFKYTRAKFNLQQYPQVVKNYMKSKNLELESLPLGEKALDQFSTVETNIKLDFSSYKSDPEEVEALQTPSNASELEGANELCSTSKQALTKDSVRKNSKPFNTDADGMARNMKLISIPMPKTACSEKPPYSVPYTSTVINELVDSFMPDMVLQGITKPEKYWGSRLKSNLALNTQHSLLDQPVEESLAIVANTDTWEVQVTSSHTYVIDKGSTGVRVGMSQFVANMLESLLHMWKLHIPPQYCIMHIEEKLQELCVLSKALAQFLLVSEFCNMELLTSALHLEVNDVPLLMAVASTHTPQVTQKYGLSFQ
ncbi:folliculin-interacting protein 2 isoform X2 [Cylas formicarius]|uniref:folliculin-interacting protein 2 isoform X2 n=1 Tax=Cylas formicarius TaxID=197179 RepID=UPI0029588688|nr:folliculin-interacting protein 2 isoform X2 [Cylas formicarius]